MIEGLDELNTNISTEETTDSQESVETSADSNAQENTVTEDSADINTEESTNSDSPVNTEATEESTSDDKTETPTDIDTKNLSGVEQYLAQFDIEGGMIDFKDGSRVHFDELPAEKQVDVLSKLHAASTHDIEEKYGLDENEIGLINYMRQQEGSIDEVIDRLAQQRAHTYITAQTVNNLNVEEMSADEVYTAHLLKSNKNATAEQLEEDLATAKKMSNFNNIVSSLKQDMITEQQKSVIEQKQAGLHEIQNEIESQRKEVVDVVSEMDSIDGLAINDGIKNDVLDLILDVDNDGDSRFMTEVFSDPNNLFKAAFWYKNGLDIVSTREEFWKKEKSAAYKRGLADARNGKKSFIAKDVKDKNKTTPHYDEPEDIISFDDIHNI